MFQASGMEARTVFLRITCCRRKLGRGDVDGRSLRNL